MHDRERKAGIHAPTIDVNGASTALPVVASFLSSEKAEMLAQRVQQSDARFNL
jgi:hypothetical protein